MTLTYGVRTDDAPCGIGNMEYLLMWYSWMLLGREGDSLFLRTSLKTGWRGVLSILSAAFWPVFSVVSLWQKSIFTERLSLFIQLFTVLLQKVQLPGATALIAATKPFCYPPPCRMLSRLIIHEASNRLNALLTCPKLLQNGSFRGSRTKLG